MTYQPGEDVAVKGAIRTAAPRWAEHAVLITDGKASNYSLDVHEVAPGLSAEDQEALMRLARLAIEWDDAPFRRDDADDCRPPERQAAHNLSLAIACLPAALRDRVMGGEG